MLQAQLTGDNDGTAAVPILQDVKEFAASRTQGKRTALAQAFDRSLRHPTRSATSLSE